MKLILDTHVALWWFDDPGLLSEAAREAIAEPVNEVYVSAVTAWEVAIKRGLGKLQAPNDLVGEIRACGFLTLAITIDHALATEHLPSHHRDPFDRMLIAQAQLEGAAIVTRDPMFSLYGVPVIPC